MGAVRFSKGWMATACFKPSRPTTSCTTWLRHDCGEDELRAAQKLPPCHSRSWSSCFPSPRVPFRTTTTSDSCSLKNSAFVFVKPHANTEATQKMVREKLLAKGIEILSESDIDGNTIDEKKLIDQHYYAIASKATILAADKIPVPEDKFEESFGEKWCDVLKEGRAANAMQACEKFGCTADELNEAWQGAKVVKFGGGFYCGLVSVKDQTPLYVFNAFFMVMRSKFVGEGVSIHCYEVQWEPKKLSWESFRGELLGPTDPAECPEGSIRKAILDK